ncbi:hypothetical protein G4G93_35040 [Methylobacterium sp. DB0501]|uniref:hypothetical protein n=1 Tax=Methylobacterium sp. DB0501 TaxID=2709665 RepID=UPI0013EB4BF1|nr:hypothetical protein [Methylobacterium sp. DB0501]NGM39035.1 hypothetical protein [Methylobacterium sp. DB0501]
MSQTLIAGLKATATELQTAGKAMTSAAERLELLAAALEKEIASPVAGDAGPVYKKPNGRLTEAGAAAVDAGLAAGMTLTAIAKNLDVHISAISKRKKAKDKLGEKSS